MMFTTTRHPPEGLAREIGRRRPDRQRGGPASRVQRVAFALAVALVAAACSGAGDVAGLDEDAAARFAAARDGSSEARFLPDPPVLGVRMAAGVDERGLPVGPAVVFAPGEPQVTAVVVLGEAPEGATLTVAWSRLDGAGDPHALFSHDIAVAPFRRAYSVGVSRGMLAAGWYEVTASLGEHEVAALWRVADAGADAAAAGAFHLASRAQLAAAAEEAANAEPPVAGDSGSVDWDWHHDPDTGERFADHYDDDGNPVYPEDMPEPEPQPCALSDLRGDYEFFTATAAVWMPPRADCDQAAIDGITIVASIEGPPVLVGRGKSAWFYPCALPGGSDMPGTVIHVVAWLAGEEAGSVADEIEIEDQEALVVALHSDPAPGSTVEPGQTVRVGALAMEGLMQGPGIRSLKIMSPEGELLAEDYEIADCDPLRHMKAAEVTYTVPADPPPIIELRAVVEDDAGRQASETITFVTEETWAGVMRSEATQTGDGFQCMSAWEGAIQFTVDRDGAVSGGGRVDLVGSPECSFGYNGSPMTFVEFAIHGRRDDDRFAIQLELINYNPGDDAGAWLAGHFAPLAKGTPEAQEFTVPITRPGVVEEQVSLPWDIPGADGEVIDTFELTCETCQQGADR